MPRFRIYNKWLLSFCSFHRFIYS